MRPVRSGLLARQPVPVCGVSCALEEHPLHLSHFARHVGRSSALREVHHQQCPVAEVALLNLLEGPH